MHSTPEEILSSGGRLRVALITDAEHPGLRSDDVGLVEAFRAEGAIATPVPWGSALIDDGFDLAVIRTPWDYFLRPEAFGAWIDGLVVPVLNPKGVLRWNMDKRYLPELRDTGAAQIPRTALLEAGEGNTAEVLKLAGAARAVVKPVVSGGAHGTRVVSAAKPLVWDPSESGTYIVQEFVESVTAKGEWSLIYFGGEFSHSVLKAPRAGDFRVQDDFGGTVSFDPPPGHLFDVAEKVLAGAQTVLGLTGPLPYARVDLVEAQDRGPALLMELELIEPELFFRADPASKGRFAREILSATRS